MQDFYRGDVGREIAADLERIGSPVTRADLEKYEARIAEPLSVKIAAGTLHNTAPPTQGLASLMILALFDRLRVAKAESFEHIHGLVEATKRAFLVRDRFVTDLRPLVAPEAHACHPYDVSSALLLEEAGGVVTDPWGEPLDTPLDTTSPIAWAGYANQALADWIGPVLAELVDEHR